MPSLAACLCEKLQKAYELKSNRYHKKRIQNEIVWAGGWKSLKQISPKLICFIWMQEVEKEQQRRESHRIKWRMENYLQIALYPRQPKKTKRECCLNSSLLLSSFLHSQLGTRVNYVSHKIASPRFSSVGHKFFKFQINTIPPTETNPQFSAIRIAKRFATCEGSLGVFEILGSNLEFGKTLWK